MYRISQVKLPIEHSENDLYTAVAKTIKMDTADILMIKIIKQSIDARDKTKLLYVYTLDFETKRKINLKKNNKVTLVEDTKYNFTVKGTTKLNKRPIIVGFGPAGMFCGLFLARAGYKPIILERGQAVDERIESVNHFWETGELNTESNVQFGEGGAGTFSDGKLNTMVKDKFGRNKLVLECLVEHGAKDEILYVNKPHIGTDELCGIVKSIRKEIISLGGDVRFNTKLTDLIIRDKKIVGLKVNDNEIIESDVIVLACGHSARDTFYMLRDTGINIEAKAFAVGLRVMHPQSMINESQYGAIYKDKLPAAPYKLTSKTKNGRGVYSFCMCPGGYVVNASSEEGMLAVNGMSYSGRDSENANSAIIVTVQPEDFGGDDVLAGVEFQRRLERKAYEEGCGSIPIQIYADYKDNKKSTSFGKFEPYVKGKFNFGNIRKILPENINEAFIEGMESFGKIIDGFSRPDTILAGVESRTSSPVRIIRDETGEGNVAGLYPCGEGAGYAGGITSAAMDGIKIAEKIADKYRP